MTDVCEICGFPVSRLNLKGHVREITERANKGIGSWYLTLNTEMLARCAREPDYWNLIQKADTITADGMPLVWASNVKCRGAAIDGRTTGVDIVDALLRMDEVPRFAVIGGVSPLNTVELYGSRATEACAYIFDGKVDLSDHQMALFCEKLISRGVRVVFIALGVPKQDHLAIELRRRVPQLILLGIGGTFEILGPKGSRAPLWMQRGGLEWMYRLAIDPRRLWRRYLIKYPQGVWFLVKGCLVGGQ